MSRGKNLQEMETGTAQSRTAVNANAKAAEPMPHLTGNIPDGQSASWEDCGGPTPENYKPDDDSAKMSPGSTLKQVRDVVTRGAKAAEAMKKMKEEKEEDKEEDDEEEDEKKKNKKKSEDDDDEDMEEEYDIESDVNALISGEDLSEEFKEKAKTIFEAALKSKVNEIKEALESQYVERLNEEIEEIKEEFQDRVDSYLEYVSEEWIEENQLAIEHGLKSELTESFLMGMKQLFEDHYVSIPEEKYDVVESMVDKLDEMEGKLNEQIERNVALNRRLAESVADVIFADISEGLALSQKDKLSSLAVNVEFDGEENYREKLVTLRESYFPHKAGAQRDNSETLTESTDVQSHQPQVDGRMASYLQTLGRVTK